MLENTIITGDCIEEIAKLPPACVDLVFADPPFNIKYKYDVYEDNKSVADYLEWTKSWGLAAARILKSSGSIWVAMGDAFASDIDVLFRRNLGFYRRSWVIWHYTFGVNATKKFTPSHTHLFHYVCNPDHFTFNGDAIRVPSARQEMGDKRAKAGGRLPDDVWVLRPAAEPTAFQSRSDTWAVPRVAGTHAERVGWHPCQMPEAVLERVIKVSTNEGDLVGDIFAGSGTTLAVAKKLNRRFFGVELSEAYASGILERLDNGNIFVPTRQSIYA